MRQLLIRPEIHEFKTFEQFHSTFEINRDDLLLTNQYIYDRFIQPLRVECRTIFQEAYGAGEPTDLMVESIMAKMKEQPCQRVIAVGGGTILDIAKILVLNTTSDSKAAIDQLYEAKSLKKNKTLILIPTTCGTGSEMTNISVINRTRKETKQGLVSPAMYADYAVLIPELLGSLPHTVFATSSIDALIHAVEAYLSPANTPFSEIFAKSAIELILSGYCQIARAGESVKQHLYGDFLRAAAFAGIAFGNSGCAAVHAMSYALGGCYHVAHGESNYVFFTSVLRMYNRKAPGDKMKQLLQWIQQILKENNFKMQSSNTPIESLDALLAAILEKKPMHAYGAVPDDLMPFTESTIKNQQRLLKNNYVPLSYEEILEIFQECL